MKKAYFLLRYSMIFGLLILVFQMGRSSYKDDVRTQKMRWFLELQAQHRDQSDSAIRTDRHRRELVMLAFNRSLLQYGKMISDPLFDQLVNIAEDARVLSIQEADSMCLSKGDRLSVIPVGSDEYLLFRGSRQNRMGSYDGNARLIILWLDQPLAKADPYSISAAKIYLHELGHDYLKQQGVSEGTEFEHWYIAHMQSRFSSKLVGKYGKDFMKIFAREVYCELPDKPIPLKDIPQEEAQKMLYALHEEQLILRFA